MSFPQGIKEQIQIYWLCSELRVRQTQSEIHLWFSLRLRENGANAGKGEGENYFGVINIYQPVFLLLIDLKSNGTCKKKKKPNLLRKKKIK